jgi:hypothetical protein
MWVSDSSVQLRNPTLSGRRHWPRQPQTSLQGSSLFRPVRHHREHLKVVRPLLVQTHGSAAKSRFALFVLVDSTRERWPSWSATSLFHVIQRGTAGCWLWGPPLGPSKVHTRPLCTYIWGGTWWGLESESRKVACLDGHYLPRHVTHQGRILCLDIFLVKNRPAGL